MCPAPNLVPFGPNAVPQYQSCAIQGSRPGQATVLGADYTETAFEYSRVHLWRNIGILCGYFVFFAALTCIGQELQKPNAGGGAITIFKRGQAPKAVTKAMENGNTILDEEKGAEPNDKRLAEDSSGSESQKEMKGLAKSDTVFTYQNVNYTIPTKDGDRQLLNNVQGFVRPGKLTALMGASGAGKVRFCDDCLPLRRLIDADYLVEHSCSTHYLWSRLGRFSGQRPSLACFVSEGHWVRGTDGRS